MSDCDLVVIGAGPGGYAAAFLAADLGMQVTLVDAEERLGGVCLQKGCIPSKALLHVARLIKETQEASQWGIQFGRPEINLDQLREWKDQVVSKLTGGLGQLSRQRKVQYVQGRARFLDSQTVEVSGGDNIRFRQCILATGSRPILPGPLDIGDPRVMDSTGALELEEIPEKLLIVGGGYIGLEMGTVYSALGSEVSVVEMTDGILPGVDRDLVRILQARLRKEFKAIHLNTRLEKLESRNKGLKAILRNETELLEEEFGRVLIAVGRRPNSENLGLENTRIKLDDRGFVLTNPQLQTDEPSIYAIGDIIGGAMLAHKASHEARAVVERLAGSSKERRTPVMPAVVFTDPEIAWAGLSETEATARDIDVSIAKFPWGASGRATTLSRNDGLTKLLLEPDTGKILGIGLVGAGAGELIAEGVLAVELGARAEDMATAIHPHPTLSETLMEAAEVHGGHPTHIAKRGR